MIWEIGQADSGVVLCGRQAPGIPSNSTSPGSFGCYDRDVRLGCIEDQCGENGRDDLPDVFHGQPTFRGIIQAVDDERRPVITGLPKLQGKITELICIPSGQVTGGTLPDPAQDLPGVIVREHPAYGIDGNYQVITLFSLW